MQMRLHSFHSGDALDRVDESLRLLAGGDISVQEHVVAVGRHVDPGDVEAVLEGPEGGTDRVGEHSVFDGWIRVVAGEAVAEALEAPALVAHRPGHGMSQSAGEAPTSDGLKRRHPDHQDSGPEYTKDAIAPHGLLHSWSLGSPARSPKKLQKMWCKCGVALPDTPS